MRERQAVENFRALMCFLQELKKKLHDGLKQKGYGIWVGKPAEQDMFFDQPDEAAPATPTTASAATPAASILKNTPTEIQQGGAAASSTPAAEESPQTRTSKRTRGKPKN